MATNLPTFSAQISKDGRDFYALPLTPADQLRAVLHMLPAALPAKPMDIHEVIELAAAGHLGIAEVPPNDPE